MSGRASTVSVHTMAARAGSHIHLAPSRDNSGGLARARRSNRKGPLGSGPEKHKGKCGEHEAQCPPSADSVEELEGGGHGLILAAASLTRHGRQETAAPENTVHGGRGADGCAQPRRQGPLYGITAPHGLT